MVGNNHLQVLVDGEEGHGTEVGQHIGHHRRSAYVGIGMGIHALRFLLLIQVGRHHQHGRLNHHHGLVVGLLQYRLVLERLAHIGSHGYAAPDDIRQEIHRGVGIDS